LYKIRLLQKRLTKSRGIALALAREGAKVSVLARTKKELDSVVEEMGGEERGHVSIAVDLTEPSTPTSACDQLENIFGKPEIVIHCIGGTLSVRDPLAPIEDWRRVTRLNLEIAIELNNCLVPNMIAKKWGRVIHVSSIAAKTGTGSPAYSTAKAALNAYTVGLGRAVASDGVVVTSIMPGAILTPGGSWESALRDDPEYAHNYLRERVASGRFGTVEEVSDFVAFLCSAKSSLFAGAVLPIDGGTN
jgi:3-oxoacyl-[acyl-carrier protein] reductase